MLLRILLGTSTIFLSMIIGAFALAVVGYNWPETLSMMLGWARDLKAAITSTGLDPKYNIWVEILLEERQLLFMFFTIAARIFLALLAAPFLR
jgi:hypothetical protein